MTVLKALFELKIECLLSYFGTILVVYFIEKRE